MTEFDAATRTAYGCLLAAGIAWAAYAVGSPDRNTGPQAAESTQQSDAQQWQVLKRRWWRELPDAPSAPTVEAASTGSLLVTWEAPDSTTDIAGYDVEFRVHDAVEPTIRELAGTETVTTIDGLISSTLYHVRVRAVNDAGPGDWSASGAGMTANAAPVFPEGAAAVRTVPENSPGGYEVGAPIRATDADSDTLTYGVDGADAEAFAIDASTGQLRTRSDHAYDHEADPSHELAVTAADGHGNQAEIAVSVHVADELEPPLKPDPPTVTATRIDTLTVSWIAPANAGRPDITGYELQYRGSGRPFVLWRETPAGTRAELTGLQGDTYAVQVRAINDEGKGAWSDSGHGTVRGNRSPTVDRSLLSDLTMSVEETERRVPVRTAFSDPDGDNLTLAASSSDRNVVTATMSGDSVSLRPAATGTARVDITATDTHGATATGSFEVTIEAAPPKRPNLVVDTLTVDDANLNTGDSFTLSATVKNAGDGDSTATTLRYYRSTNDTISRADTQVGTDTVGALAASGSSAQSILLTAPSASGRHYYGACVDPVSGESDTTDNCSSSVQVDVVGSTAPSPGFDIDIVFVDPQPSAAIRSAVNAAAAVWEGAITNDLPDIDFSADPRDDACTDGEFAGFVDDLRVYIYVVDIDGPGGTTASAGYCMGRTGTSMPIIGRIRLDSADVSRLSSTIVRYVAVHELAHVLGFGARWDVQNPSIHRGQPVDPPPDTHFPGANAVAAFNAAGGTNYQGGKVPVENERGGVGIRDKHWRLSVFPGEIMTDNLDGTALSAITIQAMADLGFTVNAGAADPYSISSTVGSPARVTAARESPLRCEIDALPVEYFPEASAAFR